MAEPDAVPEVHTLLIDQRRRVQLGEPFHVELYLSQHPGLAADPEGLLDLIYNEVLLRGQRGESPELDDYRTRFPDLAEALGDLFEVHRAIESSPEVSTAPVLERSAVPVLEPAWPKLDGYEIVGILGSGGMGIVYRARDLKRGVTVAVKTMRQADAASLYRFKQEFRALLDVSHPNLVTLHELISDGVGWFIVMEYIDGLTFLDYIHASPCRGDDPTSSPNLETTWWDDDLAPVTLAPVDNPATESRDGRPSGGADVVDRKATPAPGPLTWVKLRGALRQLAEGLSALHQAGKLHRDIKPTNVMVTRLGRVVLMDFGLITSPERGAAGNSTEGQVVGTAAYMAPEQAAGVRLSAASDWYSVGVMIYEALTGRRPFEGRMLDVLMDKQRFEPPAPGDLVAGLPDDLNALCVELLRRDPRSRPGGREVLARLGATDAGPAGGAEPGSSQGLEPVFVGRESHRAALAHALARAAEGKTVVVYVHGASGVGKSALIQTFLSGLAARDEAVVLAGRCYERESVPYKALDGVIDALSRHLRHLPAHEVGAILPRDVGPLARVFPVLRRVEAVAGAPRRATEAPDPQELRRRAYAALRELLARLGDRRPLVVAIDDLQWGDGDSLAVLSEILRPPDTPAMLLLACYRSEDSANPVLRAALTPPGAQGLDCRELSVGTLSPDDAHALARHMLGVVGGDAEGRARWIASESGGNPLFVAELARSEMGQGPVALDEVLWSRILRLPDDARGLLEVVAVSGSPVSPAVAWQCLGREGDERATLALLRTGRLIRAAGRSSDGDRIEAYHDRVRETVVAHLGPAALGDCHGRLAVALEASGTADHEELGVHYQRAGDDARAGAHFALAAAKASEALAFERASSLYRLALNLSAPDPAESNRLRGALAGALANAGRGAEAAREYLAACDGATVARALELRRLAAMQFLISGHIDQGLDALRDVLLAIGMTLPQSPRHALASLLWRRMLLRLRGLKFRPRDTSEVAAADLTRIDVCWSASVGLSNVDWIRGADFQARGLLLALRAGEPYRVARALALEAAQNATTGLPARDRTSRLLEQAGALARSSGQPYGLGMVTLAEGVSAYLEGRWLDALNACDRAEVEFRDRCTGVAWELDTAHAYSLWALSHLGHWAELSRRFPVLLNEARERGDLYAAMNLSTYILSIVRLAADDPEAARDETRRVTGQWSRQGYHVQHNDQVWASVQIDLYRGDGPSALRQISAHWPTLTRSLLMRVQFIRVAMLGLHARCALASGDRASLPSAARDASRIEREHVPWGDPQAHMIRAALASLGGRRDEALTHLRSAGSLFRACDMLLCASVAELRLGQLLGGTDGRVLIDRAEAWLTSQSVRRPDRVADLFAPGFRLDGP